jgi:hypothetical protein
MTDDIEVHIAELVLHGFGPDQRQLIADHLAAALGPALAEHGIGSLASAGHIDHLQAAPVEVARPITARDAGRLGTSIAASLRQVP